MPCSSTDLIVATAEKQGNQRLAHRDMRFMKTKSHTNMKQRVCLPGDPTTAAGAAFENQSSQKFEFLLP
jgi:hypothetical protein